MPVGSNATWDVLRPDLAGKLGHCTNLNYFRNGIPTLRLWKEKSSVPFAFRNNDKYLAALDDLVAHYDECRGRGM
jgi:hypothetical protein